MFANPDSILRVISFLAFPSWNMLYFSWLSLSVLQLAFLQLNQPEKGSRFLGLLVCFHLSPLPAKRQRGDPNVTRRASPPGLTASHLSFSRARAKGEVRAEVTESQWETCQRDLTSHGTRWFCPPHEPTGEPTSCWLLL